MTNTDKSRLVRLIEKFSRCRILVVGDVMVDEYIWGRVTRISPEAPVPVVERRGCSLVPGGAGNVVRTLISLGANVTLIGEIGQDSSGEWLRSHLQSEGVGVNGLVEVPGRETTVKTRIIAHKQQVVRVDSENKSPIDGPVIEELLRNVENELDSVNVVILSDYAKGLLHEKTIPLIVEKCLEKGVMVAVDPAVHHADLYRGVTVLTPNHHEAALMAGREMETEDDVEDVGTSLAGRLGCRYLVITRGEDGMTVLEAEQKAIEHIPAVAREVFDVTGAGDTVIGTLALGLAAGGGILEAAIISNYAAGVVVAKFGTATVTVDELKEVIG